MWVLTGDNLDTAVNIGYNSRLILEHYKLVLVEKVSPKDIHKKLAEIQTRTSCKTCPHYALVFVGTCLDLIFQDSLLTSNFIKICLKAHCVIGCRLTPEQKQRVVQAFRNKKPKAITLALGDGANDINMITHAQIGILHYNLYYIYI